MKNLLRYRFASLKEARFYVLVFSFIAFVILVSCFLHFITISKKESVTCSLINEVPILGQKFAYSMHMTLLTTLPLFSYCLGLILGYVFISSDFEKKRLRMIFGSSLGKRMFYRNGILASNLVGLSFVFAYWLFFAVFSFWIWPVEAKEGNIFFSAFSTLLCSIVLFWVSLLFFSTIGVLTKKGSLTCIFGLLIFFVAILHTIVMINEKKILSMDRGPFTLNDELNLVSKNPIASFVLLSRYGDSSALWNYLGVGVVALPFLYVLGRLVYEKKEVA